MNTQIYTCPTCRDVYQSQRALSIHISKPQWCQILVYNSLAHLQPLLSNTKSEYVKNTFLPNLFVNNQNLMHEFDESSQIDNNEDNTSLSSNSGKSVMSHTFYHTTDINQKINF